MKARTFGAITLALVSTAVWSQVNITNDSSNSQVIEIGNANTGEVVIDNGATANVDASGNTELRTGNISAEVSPSSNVELGAGSVTASTTSSGETNLSTGDLDANIGSDGSIGLNVGDINLKVK